MSKGGGACQVLFLRKLYRRTSQSSPSPKPTPQGGEVKAETSNSEKPWLRSELPQQEDGATTGGKRPRWPWLMEWWCYWWWRSWWSGVILLEWWALCRTLKWTIDNCFQTQRECAQNWTGSFRWLWQKNYGQHFFASIHHCATGRGSIETIRLNLPPKLMPIKAYLHVPLPLNWPNMLIVSGNIFLRRGTFSERSCRSTWGTTLSALVGEERSTRLVSVSQGLGGRRVHQVKIRD